MSRLFGYSVFDRSRSELILELDRCIVENQRVSVVSLNTLKLYQGSQDAELRKLLSSAEFIIPDGQSIALAEKCVHGRSVEAISGAELMVQLIKHAEQKGYRLFFLGSPQDLLNRVEDKIKTTYPGLSDRVAFQHGYYDQSTEEQAVIDRISEFQPDFLFVAFGSPRKEEFILHNKDRLAKVNMGVGGSYEYFVGDVKLDGLTKKLGLRWLVRTIQDPRRLAKRYATCNAYFLRLLLQEMFSKGEKTN